MDRAINLLREQIKEKSISKVAKEMGVSRATVSLLSRKRYPNPEKMYRKVLEVYEGNQEIIGAECLATNLSDLAKEIECL